MKTFVIGSVLVLAMLVGYASTRRPKPGPEPKPLICTYINHPHRK